MLFDKNIFDIAKKDVVKIKSTETIGHAIDEMVKHRFRRLLVENDEERVIGIVTSSDILRTLYKEGSVNVLSNEIRSLMERKIVVANYDDKISQSILLMYNMGIGSLPVIKSNEVKGIFTNKDVLLINEIWNEIGDDIISHDEGIGRPIDSTIIISDDFSIWQAIDRISQGGADELIVRKQEDNQIMGILTSMGILKNILSNLYMKNYDVEMLQGLVINRVSLEPYLSRPVPTIVSSIRFWMISRNIQAVPLYYLNKPIKLVTEKDLVGYVANKITETRPKIRI